MRRTITRTAFAIGLCGALWLAFALATSSHCSKWNPFSCGPDPELTKWIR